MKKLYDFRILLILFCAIVAFCIGTNSAVAKGIEFRWASPMIAKTLDPIAASNDPQFIIEVNLYDTLIYPDPKKEAIPWIAESWTISPEKKKFTFRLKKGIPFHDGTEITAEDVVFSMDRMLTVGGYAANFFKRNIKPGAIKMLDKYTVEMNLVKPDPKFFVSMFKFKILNKALIMKNKEEGKYGKYGDYGVKFLQHHDAGSGPFMAVEHKFGDRLKMKRFDKYPFTKKKQGSFDALTMYFIPEMVTIATKLKKGELDMCHWALPLKIQRELKKNEAFDIREVYVTKNWYIAMNNTKPPLDCKYVRKACSHAYNFDVVTKHILAGGRRLIGPLGESMRAGCEGIKVYEYDLEKAKALLKKSKYSMDELKNFKMEFAAVSGSERFKKIGLQYCSELKKLGFNAQMKALRWPDICQYAKKRETAFHFALENPAAKVPHPYYYMIYYTPAYWGAPEPVGGIFYDNPKVVGLIDKGNDAASLEDRNRFYCEASKIIAEDAPLIFSHEDYRMLPAWRYVKGYVYDVGCNFYDFRFDRLYMDTADSLFKKNHK